MQLIDIHTHRPTSAVTIRTVGVHPWQAVSGELPTEEDIMEADAVGEIGLDKACGVDVERQTQRFEEQLRLAEKHHKAVVIHCVKAFEEVMRQLAKHRLRAVIFHGFIGSREKADRAVKNGYCLSFGARTFRSRKTIEALRSTPLESLFVETDEAQEPLEEIYRQTAILRGVTVEELEQKTTENYQRLFGKDDE